MKGAAGWGKSTSSPYSEPGDLYTPQNMYHRMLHDALAICLTPLVSPDESLVSREAFRLSVVRALRHDDAGRISILSR